MRTAARSEIYDPDGARHQVEVVLYHQHAVEQLTEEHSGTALGFVLALSLTRFLETQLYNVSVNDAVAFRRHDRPALVAVALLSSRLPERYQAFLGKFLELSQVSPRPSSRRILEAL